MPNFALPIDYDAIRACLVSAIAVGTGLPEQQIIMLEGEGLESPRPASPYFGILITTPSVKMGFDWFTSVKDAPGEPTGLFNYTGPRSMSVSFDCFANTHELAYGLMAAWQGALDQPPTRAILDQAGLSAEDVGPVTDLSTLLNTSFEGRAHMDVSFSMMASVQVDVGQITSVPVTADIYADARQVIQQFTVTKET